MRPITDTDVRPIAEVIAAAFGHDPFWSWLFPDAPRHLVVRSWITQLRAVYLPKGHSYMSDDADGAALWAPPNSWRMNTRQTVRVAPSYLRLLGLRRLRSGMRAFDVIDAAHPLQPHWYLSVLGVDPAHQRRGIGGSLIEPMLARAERDNVPTHLETFNEANVGYYERFGFNVTKEDRIEGGPRMWGMARPPRP